jgi:hypothetical protein
VSRANNVYFNNINANTTTIFDDVLPIITRDASLIQSDKYTYVDSDGSEWYWNGTTYIITTIALML